MALKTFGSNANNSLRAVQFNPSAGVMTDADLASFNADIQANYGGGTADNIGPTSNNVAPYVTREGQMNIPGRGWIKLLPGDWLVLDLTTGFPFVLSQAAVASGPYTHS